MQRRFHLQAAFLAWCLSGAGMLSATEGAYRDPTGDSHYVRISPPAPRAETIPAGMSGDQAWIPGHWGWQQDAFVWRSGVVVAKPASATGWQPGRWEKVVTRHRGWRWVPGTWLMPSGSTGTGGQVTTLP